MYVSGTTRGTVRNGPGGFRLKLETKPNSIAAEWPIAASLEQALASIERYSPEPLSVTGGERRRLRHRGALAGLEREFKGKDRLSLKGARHLFALTRGPGGSYLLACRMPKDEWTTVVLPLVSETAKPNTKAALSEMYREIA